MQPVTNRAYSPEPDYSAVSQFLIDTYGQFGWMYNWGIAQSADGDEFLRDTRSGRST